MTNLAVTTLVHSLHYFERDFWLSYKALEQVCSEALWEIWKTRLLKSKRVDKELLSQIDVQAFEQKRAEIDADWLQKSEEAKNLGTSVHEMIHNAFVTDLFQAQKDFNLSGEVQSSEVFLTGVEGLFPEQRMEIKLDDDYQLVGVADVISIHDGVVDVIDWKTDEDGIKFKGHYDMAKKHERKLKYPLSKLPDVNGIHYQLQLSIYMWMILQLRPDLKPGKLKISWIQDMKVKRTFEVDYLQAEVEKLIPWHLKAAKLKKATEECREIIY